MKRREFISKTALFSLLLAGLNPLNVFGSGFNAADDSMPAIAPLGQQRPADRFQCVIVVLVLSATNLLEQWATLRLAPERTPGRQS